MARARAAAPALALALAAVCACLAARAAASGPGYRSAAYDDAGGRAFVRAQRLEGENFGEFELQAWDAVDKTVLWTAAGSRPEYIVEARDGKVRVLSYDQELVQATGAFGLLLDTYDAATGNRTSSEEFFKGDIVPPPVTLPSGEIFAVVFDSLDPGIGGVNTGIPTISLPSGKKFTSVLNSEEESEGPDIEHIAASPVDNAVYYPYTFNRPDNRVSLYDAGGDNKPVTAPVGEALDDMYIFGTVEQKDHMFVYGGLNSFGQDDATVSVNKVSKDLSTVSWTYSAFVKKSRPFFDVSPLGLFYAEGYIVLCVTVTTEAGVTNVELIKKDSEESTNIGLPSEYSVVLIFLDAETGDLKRAVAKTAYDASNGSHESSLFTDNPLFYSPEDSKIVLTGEFPSGSGQFVSDIDIDDDLEALGVPSC